MLSYRRDKVENQLSNARSKDTSIKAVYEA